MLLKLLILKLEIIIRNLKIDLGKYVCISILCITTILATLLLVVTANNNYSSSEMNTFLRETRQILSARSLQQPLLIVLGNESCDLDSAISAITLAFFYSKHSASTIPLLNEKPQLIMPLLNIPRKDLPLKTEVTHFLRQNGVDLENVICRDELSTEQLKASKFILVDHNNSPEFQEQVVQIIDHHKLNDHAKYNCDKTISLVASCATLIADLMLKTTEPSTYSNILKMLYAVIVLDTVNFSKAADKTRPEDTKVVTEIENLLNLDPGKRIDIFNELVEARSDVSALDSLQILSKDLKIIQNLNGTKFVALPGFPMLTQEYIKLPNAKENVKTFCNEHNNCNAVVLMGMKVTDDLVERDLGVINFEGNSTELFNDIVEKFVQSGNSTLERIKNISFLDGKFFKQNNIKVSRKQLLPICQEVLDKF